MLNPNKRGMLAPAATQKQGMLEIIFQLNRRCWRIFSNAPLNRIVSIQKLGSFLSLDLFSTKTRKSHERVKLPKFRNQPQNRLENRNIFLFHNKYKIIAFS